MLTDEIFQVLEGSRESLEEVKKDPKIEQYGIYHLSQTCDNKEVAKHRVDAIVVNKDLTRVTK